MDRQSHSFHAYASLLAKITSLLDHLLCLVFKHVLRKGNVCANFLARLGRNSTLGVTTQVTPPDGLLSLLNFDAFDFQLAFVFFCMTYTQKNTYIIFLLSFSIVLVSVSIFIFFFVNSWLSQKILYKYSLRSLL